MATYTNQLLVLVGGKIQKISSTDNLAIGGSLSIGGNLEVTGDIISHGTVNVVTSDAFIDLAVGQTSTTAAPAGLAMTMKRLGTATYTSVSFTAGVGPAVSAPNIVISGDASADIVTDDLVEITGATPASNNGIYLVASSVYSAPNTTLTLYGTGGTAVPAYMNFVQSQVTTATDAAATAFQPYVTAFAAADGVQIQTSVPAAIALGKIAFAAGGTKASFNQNWTEVGSGTVTNLQTAYDGGNSITLTNGSDFDINVPGAGTAGITLDANATSNFSVAGATLTLSATAAGGSVVVAGRDGVTVNSTNGNIGIGNDGNTGAINIGTGASARTITIGNSTGATAVNINTGSGGIDVSAAGASTFNVTTGALDIDSAGALSLNSSGGAINIGDDNVAQAINVGTGNLVRTITVGNSALGSSVMVNSPAGSNLLSVAAGVTAGDILYVDSSGVCQLADATATSPATQEVEAIALETTGGSPAVKKIASLNGSIVGVKFVSGNLPVIGDIAYLSTTAGQAVKNTPPSGAGQVVFKIGKVVGLADLNGNYPVLFNPQYIATN